MYVIRKVRYVVKVNTYTIHITHMYITYIVYCQMLSVSDAYVWGAHGTDIGESDSEREIYE